MISISSISLTRALVAVSSGQGDVPACAVAVCVVDCVVGICDVDVLFCGRKGFGIVMSCCCVEATGIGMSCCGVEAAGIGMSCCGVGVFGVESLCCASWFQSQVIDLSAGVIKFASGNIGASAHVDADFWLKHVDAVFDALLSSSVGTGRIGWVVWMLDGFGLCFVVLSFCKNPLFMPQSGFVVEL